MNSYLLIPVEPSFPSHRPIDAVEQLVQSLYQRSQQYGGESMQVLAAHVKTQQIWQWLDGEPFPWKKLTSKGIHLLTNASFWLCAQPPVATLLQAVQEHQLAYCGIKISDDLHALAWSTTEFTRPLTNQTLWQEIAWLTACLEDEIKAWKAPADKFWSSLAQTQGGPENSPALHSVPSPILKRRFDAPQFVNTAFKELITNPQTSTTEEDSPEQIAAVLLAQREVSQVPWIFNTWINEIEHRLGTIKPQSFPPEIHLSTTGFCNLECRFCSYTKDGARFQFVHPDQITQLDFLRHAQILRLNSGLGEPTTNTHLPSIITTIANCYPHLDINFFTNGLTLNQPNLIETLVGKVSWINVSLNAATRESWKEQCGIDQFDRVCKNLRELLRVKRLRRSLQPLVFGSMVLNRANIADLPRMPALCHELGIDRFTGIPFFALGYDKFIEKYGAGMTLADCRDQYDAVFAETVREAERYRISLEIPLPSQELHTSFGLEVRTFYNFSQVETSERNLAYCLSGLNFEQPPDAYCHFLWRCAAIGSTNNSGKHTLTETHYLYPCLGPLATADLSRSNAFRFPDSEGFLRLWQNPVFSHLRQAQHQSGVCQVCDHCRQTDTRNPKEFKPLEYLVSQFNETFGNVPAHQKMEALEEYSKAE